MALKKNSLLVLAAGALCAVTALGQTPAEMEKKITSLCVEKLGKDAETIHATVVGEKAILTGEVQEKATEELAKEVALAVPGVKKVDNQLKAKTAKGLFSGKIGTEAADTKLEMDAKSRLSDQVGSDFSKAIEVEAVDGIVCLRGTLPDKTRKEQAMTAIQKLEGVKKVVDLISVAK